MDDFGCTVWQVERQILHCTIVIIIVIIIIIIISYVIIVSK